MSVTLWIMVYVFGYLAIGAMFAGAMIVIKGRELERNILYAVVCIALWPLLVVGGIVVSIVITTTMFVSSLTGRKTA